MSANFSRDSAARRQVGSTCPKQGDAAPGRPTAIDIELEEAADDPGSS
jgi:hypothetical protein